MLLKNWRSFGKQQ